MWLKSLENLSVEGENSDFLNIFNTKIDEFFKLDQPKISKRNWLVNPWITEGLIISINKKESLYEDWKETTSVNDRTGDLHLYQKYRSYRLTLKPLQLQRPVLTTKGSISIKAILKKHGA